MMTIESFASCLKPKSKHSGTLVWQVPRPSLISYPTEGPKKERVEWIESRLGSAGRLFFTSFIVSWLGSFAYHVAIWSISFGGFGKTALALTGVLFVFFVLLSMLFSTLSYLKEKRAWFKLQQNRLPHEVIPTFYNWKEGDTIKGEGFAGRYKGVDAKNHLLFEISILKAEKLGDLHTDAYPAKIERRIGDRRVDGEYGYTHVEAPPIALMASRDVINVSLRKRERDGAKEEIEMRLKESPYMDYLRAYKDHSSKDHS